MNETRKATGKKIQQVKMSPEAHLIVREYAKHREIDVSDMYDSIVQDFLDIAEIATRRGEIEYLSSPRSGSLKSFWISQRTHERVIERAERDGVSMNRVLFTAIKHFMSKQTKFAL